jgi:dTDP-4-dehydrorhamnose reductase
MNNKSKLLVYGSNGWIGSYITNYIKNNSNFDVITGNARVDSTSKVSAELDIWKPSHVLCMVGRTYGPGCNSIDYLEQPGKLTDNLRDNLWAPITLAILCKERNIHLTYLGTGCIFSSPDKIYDEESLPDFFGSSYSIVKGFTDRFMHLSDIKDTVLNVRIRMPITDEVHPRNFITKIVNYDKICSVQNSMTVLCTLVPAMVDMMAKSITGTINLANPGTISHNEILQYYSEIVDPSFTWQNFTIEEQNQVLKSERSNNELDTTKLTSMYPDIPNIHEAVKLCLVRMNYNKI